MNWIVTNDETLINLDLVKYIYLTNNCMSIQFIFDCSKEDVNEVTEDFQDPREAYDAFGIYIQKLVKPL